MKKEIKWLSTTLNLVLFLDRGLTIITKNKKKLLTIQQNTLLLERVLEKSLPLEIKR